MIRQQRVETDPQKRITMIQELHATSPVRFTVSWTPATP
jgi:hypothetical protein